QTLTWSRVGVFSAAMFENLAPGPRRLRELFDIAAVSGEMTGEVYDGSWFDIGTPERLSEINSLHDG
ncbi:MAG: mannose-1-phosphate guanylyltransferase, partial [Pseudomonadales bacterium]